MKKVDLIVKTGHMYTMAGNGSGYVYGKSLAIDRGKILAIEDGDIISKEYSAEKEMDATHMLVMPGLIDGHMHTGHGVIRGMAQDVSRWMMQNMAPLENARSSEAKTAGSELAIAEAILSGTTTIGDDGSDMEGALSFIDKVGVRGNVSVRVREVPIQSYAAGELYPFEKAYGEKTFGEALKLYDKFHNKDGERIKVRFGPQGADFLSLELLLKCHEEAKKRGTKVHMHLEQGARENEQMMKRYGKPAVELLSPYGFFDKDFIGIHLTAATEEHVETVVHGGGSMIMCPNSIALTCGIVVPGYEFDRAGGSVGLGTDQAAGNNSHNIFSEMKAAALLTKVKHQSSTIMPAWKVVHMATIEGAKALGIDNLTGSLEVGKSADLIMLNLTEPTLAPVYTEPIRNFLPNIAYAARGNEVDTVIVNGKVLVEHRVPQTFDMNEIIRNAQRYADEISVGSSEAFTMLRGENVVYMEQGLL